MACGFAVKLRKLQGCLRDPLFRQALIRHGVAASVEHELALRSIQCSTVIDIGANRGQFALAARRCFRSARIIAFEPLPVPAATFEAVFARDSKVALHRVAIGPKAIIGSMHVSRRDDSSSLLPISKTQVDMYPGTAQVSLATVSVRPLSDLVSQHEIVLPALLKLDVQGYELEALKGCKDLLRSFAYVYAECSFRELYVGQVLADELIKWLAERGFKKVSVHNQSYDANGLPVQADILFAATSAALV